MPPVRTPLPHGEAELTALAAWVIPPWVATPDQHISACRSCGAHVLWVVTTRGKRAPLNADGTSHFSDCPDADRWRRA